MKRRDVLKTMGGVAVAGLTGEHCLNNTGGQKNAR